MSTRQGGVGCPPFDSLNLRPAGWAPAHEPDDSPTAMAENQRRWRVALGVTPVYLRQVHGSTVVDLDRWELPGGTEAEGRSGSGSRPETAPVADAAVTTRGDRACTVLVADCLPVLFTDCQGRAVAAAHAGWRGLAAGVLENTVQALCRAAGCRPSEVLAWMGPCIGPDAFEVGSDVLAAFGVLLDGTQNSGLKHTGIPHAGAGALGASDFAHTARFRYTPRPDGTPRWRADLAGLAQDRLTALGLGSITASGLCTVSDASRFFSFRRDGLTGRLAASIWRRG